jgi:hypothetical protein
VESQKQQGIICQHMLIHRASRGIYLFQPHLIIFHHVDHRPQFTRRLGLLLKKRDDIESMCVWAGWVSRGTTCVLLGAGYASQGSIDWS